MKKRLHSFEFYRYFLNFYIIPLVKRIWLQYKKNQLTKKERRKKGRLYVQHLLQKKGTTEQRFHLNGRSDFRKEEGGNRKKRTFFMSIWAHNNTKSRGQWGKRNQTWKADISPFLWREVACLFWQVYRVGQYQLFVYILLVMRDNFLKNYDGLFQDTTGKAILDLFFRELEF